MNPVKKPLQMVLLALAVVQLTACSRTVEWEEEVPLNTGETIWVHRSMPWVYKGGFGNPFDLAMLPTREQTIRFKYAGTEYTYTGRADIRWLAISPAQRPVLVAPATSFGWAKNNNYYCVVPYYVQLVPDASGTKWAWPERIDPWLYNLPANVMANVPQLSEHRRERYSSKDRDERDKTQGLQWPEGHRIVPSYQEDGCIHKYDPSMKPNGSKE
jgi:hypothetical protein